MMGWRSSPPGQAYDALVTNRQAINPIGFRRDLLQMEEEEFVATLEAERASPHFIAIELAKWRPLKADHERRMAEVAKKRADRNEGRLEEVGDNLLPYVQAGQRRRENE